MRGEITSWRMVLKPRKYVNFERWRVYFHPCSQGKCLPPVLIYTFFSDGQHFLIALLSKLKVMSDLYVRRYIIMSNRSSQWGGGGKHCNTVNAIVFQCKRKTTIRFNISIQSGTSAYPCNTCIFLVVKCGRDFQKCEDEHSALSTPADFRFAGPSMEKQSFG